MLSRLAPALAFASILAGPVAAQSSLGILGGAAELSFGETEDGLDQHEAQLQVDVAFTRFHGIQLDFGLKDIGDVTIGEIGGHLYLRPNETARYGFFAQISDVDEQSFQYLDAGIEGRFSLSSDVAVDFNVGVGTTTNLGGASTSQWDYAFVGGGVIYDISDPLTLTARVDVTEYDETDFSAVGLDTSIRLSHAVRHSSTELFAQIDHDVQLGRDGGDPITSLGIGVTWNFGASGGAPIDRPFATAAPLDSLIRRGIIDFGAP